MEGNTSSVSSRRGIWVTQLLSGSRELTGSDSSCNFSTDWLMSVMPTDSEIGCKVNGLDCTDSVVSFASSTCNLDRLDAVKSFSLETPKCEHSFLRRLSIHGSATVSKLKYIKTAHYRVCWDGKREKDWWDQTDPVASSAKPGCMKWVAPSSSSCLFIIWAQLQKLL